MVARLTPRQLAQLKSNYPTIDANLILLATLYLQRNLSNEEYEQSFTQFLNETFSQAPSNSPIVNELKRIIELYQNNIFPVLDNQSFDVITRSEAITLGIRLIANSAFTLITSDDALITTDNTILQGLTQLITHVLDEKNDVEPEQLILILNNLFEKFPETTTISAFNDLLLQAQLIQHDRERKRSALEYAKDKLFSQKKIATSYLIDAQIAFNHWKISRNNYTGLLRKIAEEADKLARKYPTIKKHILELCYVAFHRTLVDKTLLKAHFAKFSDIVNTLISLNDKPLVFLLCFHLSSNTQHFSFWTLIEIFDHPTFKLLSTSDRQTLFTVITASLNHNVPIDNRCLRSLLDKCGHPDTRRALLQCINAFYARAPFPSLATILQWVQPVATHDIRALTDTLGQHYLTFNQPQQVAPDALSILLETQLNELRHDLAAYAETSFIHKRKRRAAYLHEASTNLLSFIDSKTPAEKQALLQQTIAELYFHYATIEEASGVLSRTLEKHLIKLLHIPDDDKLNAAREQRESILYKCQTFFCAGRGFFKRYRDKAKDPVHDIIQQHLVPSIKSQIKHLKREIRALDELDRRETSLFQPDSLSQEQLTTISEKIVQKIQG